MTCELCKHRVRAYEMHVDQFILLLVEATLVGGLLLLLFHRRDDWGLSPLYVAMGGFQHMQVVLATTVYIEVVPGVTVSPGSVVLFTATLFAVLLVYIHEDAIEARKLIYALVLANMSLAALSMATGLQLQSPATSNSFQLPLEYFVSDVRVIFVGTFCLFIDTILVIVVYEALNHRRFGSFLRIFLTVTGVLCLDQLMFTTGAFIGTEGYSAKLFSGLIGKCVSGLFYSSVLWAYLQWLGNKHVERAPGYSWDVFQLLSYRQKFDILGEEYDVLEERVQQRTAELYNANRSLREREQRLQTLSRQLLDAQETERRNLARELHDEIGQLLTVIKMQMRSAQEQHCRPNATDFEDAVQTIDNTINQVRSLSLRLRPSVLDDLGLVPALEWQAEQIQSKTGIAVTVQADNLPARLSTELETVFFRIAQESLTNVMRHSQAKSANINVESNEGHVIMTILDDGIGFDATQVQTTTTGGLGIQGMKERVALVGGTLILNSRPSGGTQLVLSCELSRSTDSKAVQL